MRLGLDLEFRQGPIFLGADYLAYFNNVSSDSAAWPAEGIASLSLQPRITVNLRALLILHRHPRCNCGRSEPSGKTLFLKSACATSLAADSGRRLIHPPAPVVERCSVIPSVILPELWSFCCSQVTCLPARAFATRNVPTRASIAINQTFLRKCHK